VGLAGIEPRGHCPAPGEKAGKQLRGRWHGNSNLRIPGAHSREIIQSS